MNRLYLRILRHVSPENPSWIFHDIEHLRDAVNFALICRDGCYLSVQNKTVHPEPVEG